MSERREPERAASTTATINKEQLEQINAIFEPRFDALLAAWRQALAEQAAQMREAFAAGLAEVRAEVRRARCKRPISKSR